MPITNRALAESQYLPTSAGVAYTSASLRTTILQFTLANTSGATATASVWIVPSAGSPTNANRLFNGPLASGESRQIPQLLNVVLETGATIQWSAGTASAIVGNVSGFIQT